MKTFLIILLILFILSRVLKRILFVSINNHIKKANDDLKSQNSKPEGTITIDKDVTNTTTQSSGDYVDYEIINNKEK